MNEIKYKARTKQCSLTIIITITINRPGLGISVAPF